MEEPTILTITEDLCRILDAEITVAMAAIAARHGLTVKVGGGSFTGASFKPRVEFLVEGEVGASKKDEDAFRQFAGMFGLSAEMLGKTFTVSGEAYKIVGLAPARSRNVVKILRLRDGSLRVCPPELVKGATLVK
jgi:hypothetical protein